MIWRYLIVSAVTLSACGSPSAEQTASSPVPEQTGAGPAASASTSPSPASSTAVPAPPDASTKKVALPGAGDGGVSMDFLAFDKDTSSVWVPAGNTGSVDVIDAATQHLTRIDGFPTKEVEHDGKKRVQGPSSASVGTGVVYVGNRADATVCAVDATKLVKPATCAKLDSSPDVVLYVAATKEVWVTTPRDHTIRVLDEKTLTEKAKIKVDGEPEGATVDATRGRFYTNLEDEDKTLAIDLKTHKTVATWNAGCGKEGPRCLHADERTGLLFVACTTRIEALQAALDGSVASTLDTGAGVDDFDFVPDTRTLYVAAGKAAKLSLVHADEKGALSLSASYPTADGARNAVVDATGNVYLVHGSAAEVLVVTPPKK